VEVARTLSLILCLCFFCLMCRLSCWSCQTCHRSHSVRGNQVVVERCTELLCINRLAAGEERERVVRSVQRVEEICT
jgi:hypothetical protein